jgi:hypothetical protein
MPGAPGGKVNFLGDHSCGHSKQNLFMYTCRIPNGFRDRIISLYSSKIVDKKEILRTVSNTGTYCSSDKVGTVYLVQYILENCTVNIHALSNPCEDMACCSSVQCTVYCIVKYVALSRKPFGIEHTYIHTFLLRVTDTMTSQNIELSSWDTLHRVSMGEWL